MTGGIADIYALNVDGETAWACPYVDFPVVRIDAGVVTAWPTDVMGAAALLVDGDVVALVGGYGPCRHERVVVGTLHAGAFARVATRRLEMADGSAPPHNAVTIGRGRRLFLLTDTGYSAVSVEDILT